MIFYLILSLICFGVIFSLLRRREVEFNGKEILVIGGTSGLGFAIAKKIYLKGGKVTIAARNKEGLNSLGDKFPWNILALDITSVSSLPKLNTKFDYIFCCPGMSHPGYFKDLDIEVYRNTMDLNYFGMLNALKHYYTYNSRPFNFIMISSTTAFYTFPGYSSYSPSKAALKSFFDSAWMEMKKEGINLYIYYVSTINSTGYSHENLTKPNFTKEIEAFGDRSGRTPSNRAKVLLEQMAYKNIIVSDINTMALKIKGEVDSLKELLLLPAILVIYPIWKCFVRQKFFRGHEDQ